MINRLSYSLLAFGMLAFAGSVAWGQSLASQSGIGSLGSESGFSGEPGLDTHAAESGVKVSDETLLHVGVSAEGGYDSNVFYSETDPVTSPIVRVTPFLQLTNAERDGSVPSRVYYDLSANLTYREYVSENPNARAQRAFNPVLSGVVELGSNQTLSLQLGDQFTRIEDPPYGEGTGNITRDNNLASAQLKFAPGGGRLTGTLRYSNLVDYFESEELKHANLMGHEVLLDASWKWLPKTALFLQASQGVITYLRDDPMFPKFNSYPLRVVAGLRGLVTPKLSVHLAAGYMAGFYQGGVESPGGLSNLALLSELRYDVSMTTSMILGYRHEFQNAVVGTFYDVDGGYLALRQMLASRLVSSAFARYQYRRYNGILLQDGTELLRRDHFVVGGAQVDYFVQKWFYAGVGYALTLNDSSLDQAQAVNLVGANYVKHQVFVRLGVVY